MEWLKYLVIHRDKKGILVNDMLQGKRYTKFNTGLLSYEYNYIDNKKQGAQYSWFYDGDMHYEENWLDNQLHGRTIMYGRSNQALRYIMYIHGICMYIKNEIF